MNFEEFDKQVDLNGLKNDLKEIEENGGLGNYPEVPYGEYEVKIKSLELGFSNTDKNGKIRNKDKEQRPMLKVQLEILSGKYKKRLLFYNQVVDNTYGLHHADEFLRSLESGLDVEFECYAQYEALIMDIAEDIDGKLEYAVEYGENNGYPTYQITAVYEVE